MIKIYLAWNIVYLPLAIYEYVIWDTGILKGIIFFIKDLFLRGGHYYSGHFWFILSCIYGIAFIHFLRKKQFSAGKILIFGFFALLALCIIDEYIVKGTFQTPLLMSFQQLIALTLRSGQLLAGFYYLALSMAVTKYNKKIPSCLVWAICTIAFLIYAFSNCNLFINELCLSITAICLTVGLSRITLTDRKIYIWLRRTSLVMYYSHNLFIFLWLDVFNPNHSHAIGNVCFLLTFICTFILGCIINLIHEKTDKNSPAMKLLRLLSL